MLKLEFTNFKQPSYWVVDELFEAGSTVKNGLKIEHPSISSRHATFKLSGAMLSVNPIGDSLVLLNGEPIEGESNLTIGDHVTLGEVQIRVNDPALKQREAVPQLFSDPKVASLVPEQTRAEQVWKIKPLDKLVSQLVTVEGQLSIGRDPSNDLVVQGNHISRRHARFFIENGQLHIQDLDSSNGTYVNGERVKERSIFLGDKLRFDSSEFVVAVGKAKNALKDPEQDRTQFRAAITPEMLNKADEDADLDRDMLQRIMQFVRRACQSLRQERRGLEENRLDVQLCAHDDGRPRVPIGIDGQGRIHAEFVPTRFLEWAKGAALASVVLRLIIVGLLGLVDCIVSNPN